MNLGVLILIGLFYLFGVLSMSNIIRIKNTDENEIRKTSDFNEKFVIYCPILNSIFGIILLCQVWNEYDDGIEDNEEL